MRSFYGLGASRTARCLVLGSTFWLAACTHTAPPIPGGTDHPADPSALQAPLPTASATLVSEPVKSKVLPAMDHSRHRGMRH